MDISFLAPGYFIALFIQMSGAFNGYFILYSRIFHCTKNSQKIRTKMKKKQEWCIGCQSLLSGSTVYIQKRKYHCTLDQKVEEAEIRMMIHVRVHVMGCWEGGHMTNFLKWSETKVVALHCSFQNQLELNCTDRLQKTTKVGYRLQSLDIDYKVQTQTIKVGYRLQKSNIDCKVQTWTTKVAHVLQSLLVDCKRLQKSDIDYKVLLIDYKRLQKSDIDYKILLIPLTTVIDIYLLGPRVIQSQPAASILSRQISDGEMVGECREILQEPYSIFLV